MPRNFWFASLFLSVMAVVFTCQLAFAQSADSNSQTHPQITQKIDEGTRVRLAGNTRPEASAANDRGPVAEDFLLEHMLLQLKRSPERETALEQFIEELHTQTSPNFHQWLTATEFGEKFGVAQQDLDTISSWLESHGLKVNLIYPSGMLIDFSGTAGQVRAAFQTEIHELDVRGTKHIANMQDPQIPAAIAAVVRGVVSLHDFRPWTMYKPRANYTFTSGGSTYQAIVPGDLATIYNLNPLFTAGISGQGQTIVVIEDTNVYSTADWTTFRSTFGLSGYSSGSFSQVHPAPPSGSNNCSNPGVNGDDGEAILDAEYASAAAPSAAIELASCSDTITTFGGLIALQNLLNESSTPPAVISISYGECEAENGASANAAYSAAYQQAVTEGVSVFVAAGDEGAASCDATATVATHGIGVSGFASTSYNVAVGGTDFGDTYAGTNSSYWNSGNTATYESAKSYIPEIPWNDSCASVLISTYLGFPTTYGSSGFCNSSTGASFLTTASGSGGPSGCASGTPSTFGVVSGSCAGWAKPSWQSMVGNPKDGVRDIPDVSLFAANGVWGHFYLYCFSDPANGGLPCTGAPSGWAGAGGTSFAAPILAAIQALVNQKAGARQGNPNPVYYQLAASEYGSGGNSSCNSKLGSGVASSCIFYDVTQGDIDVNCTGSFGCFDPSGTNGVLSTSNSAYVLAYGTTTGWDFATGIGTLNAANLVNNWPTSAPAPDFSLSAAPPSVTVTQGNSGSSTISITPTNGFTGSVSLSASGLPSGVNASFSPNPSTVTSTLTLMASSTATTGTATVTITGTSGSLMHTTTVALTVNAASSPAATPVITPATGTYYMTQPVTISDATSGATIYYTTDGSQPTTSSTKYTAGFQVTATTTIRAIATAPGHSTSATATSVITIWLSPAWTYRSSVAVANPGGTTLTGYQVHVVLGASFDFTKAQPNGADIRFTANDGTTGLPFWVESWNPAGSSASLWVRVPSIPATGSSLYMYYGNSAAVSASSGSSTFDFFEDFSLGSIDTTKWTASGGTWSVVTGTEPNGQSGTMARGATNRPPNQILYSSTYTGGDYIFEAYGLEQSGRAWGIGARVNGPSNFYSANLYADLDTTNNLYEYKWLNNNGSSSSIHLGVAAVGTINLSTWYKLRMAVHGTSIDVYLNDVQKIHATDSQWATGGVALFGGESMVANFAYVRARHYAATEPTVTVGGATTSSSWLSPAWTYRSSVTVANPGGTTLTGYQVHVVLGASFDFTKAQPNGADIRFTANDGTTGLPFWVESWNPAGSSASLWVRVPSIPATGSSLYMYYGNSAAVSASSGSSTFDFFDDFSLGSIDTTKWTASGGTWSVVTGTEPNGQSGTMARGATNRPPNQILYSSTYTGGDYIFEAYGLEQSGRAWGIGARVNGPSNFYSANLYADLDTTNNLYEYKWLNNNGSSSSIHLGVAAVGTINLSTWYKLRMAVHGTSIDVYLNDVQKIHATDSQWATGGVALFGGESMVANFAYVRARHYAATEPTVTVGGATTN